MQKGNDFKVRVDATSVDKCRVSADKALQGLKCRTVKAENIVHLKSNYVC